MKTHRFTVIAGCVALTLGCSCRKEAKEKIEDVKIAAIHMLPDNKASREYLASLIVTGLTTAEITARMGTPSERSELEGGGIALDYFFSPGTNFMAERDLISGVAIYVINGSVVKWSPHLLKK